MFYIQLVTPNSEDVIRSNVGDEPIRRCVEDAQEPPARIEYGPARLLRREGVLGHPKVAVLIGGDVGAVGRS